MITIQERLQLYRLGTQEFQDLFTSCPDTPICQAYRDACSCIPIVTSIPNFVMATGFDDLLKMKTPLYDYQILLRVADQVVEAHPDSYWVYVLRARLLWGIEYYACALEDLEKACVLSSNALVCLRMYAATLYFCDHIEQALAVINKDILIKYTTDAKTYYVRHLIHLRLAMQYPEQQEFYKAKSIGDLIYIQELHPTEARKIQQLIQRIRNSH